MNENIKPPYNVTYEDVKIVFDELYETKRGSEDRLREKFENKSSKRFSRVKNALESLDILEENRGIVSVPKDLEESLSNRHYGEVLRDALKKYKPYEKLLESEEDFLDIEDVSDYFDANYGVSGRTSEAAARSFFNLAEAAGYGKYVKGYGGNSTGFRFSGGSRPKDESKDQESSPTDDKPKSSDENDGFYVELETPNKSRKIFVDDKFDWEEVEAAVSASKKRWKDKN